MDKRFFAINKLEPDLVAIFDSEEDRDESDLRSRHYPQADCGL